MPLFFFDFTLDGVTQTDEIGSEFPSLERAYIETCQAALDISMERLRSRSDPHRDSVEILDADRRPLMAGAVLGGSQPETGAAAGSTIAE